jgi:hypothetical protein
MNERFSRIMKNNLAKEYQVRKDNGGREFFDNGVWDFDTIHEYPRQAAINIRDIRCICIPYIGEQLQGTFTILLYIYSKIIPLRS